MWLILVSLLRPFHQKLEDIRDLFQDRAGDNNLADSSDDFEKKERIMQIAETDQPIGIMGLISDQLQSRLYFLSAREYAKNREKGEKEVVFCFQRTVITSKIYVGYDNTKEFYPTAVM